MEITAPRDAMLIGTALKLLDALFPYVGGAHCDNEAVVTDAEERHGRIRNECVEIVTNASPMDYFINEASTEEIENAGEYIQLMVTIQDHADMFAAMMDRMTTDMIARQQ